MNEPIKEAFDMLFSDMGLSEHDAAFKVFALGWKIGSMHQRKSSINHEESHALWLEKTEWVQETSQGKELGLHRADVLRNRIQHLQRENAILKRCLFQAQQAAKDLLP